MNDSDDRLPSRGRGSRGRTVRELQFSEIPDHFLGHGLEEPEPAARWYWRHSIIEPSARGASEVRRLFLEAVEG